MRGTETGNDQAQSLMKATVDVINGALHDNPQQVVEKRVVAVMDKLTDGRDLGVAVFKSNPAQPGDYFTLRFSDHSVRCVAHNDAAPDVTVKVTEAHLRDVCDHPRQYMADPLRLEVVWLKSRAAA